jgi:hypothetical protein
MRYYRRAAQDLEPFHIEIEFLLNGNTLKQHVATVYAKDRRHALQEAVRDLARNYEHHHLSIKKAHVSCERIRRNQSPPIH